MTPAPTAAPTKVHRFEVRPRGEGDPRARSLEQQAKAIGIPVKSVSTARVYLIEGRLNEAELTQVRESLLIDPVTELAALGAQAVATLESQQMRLPGWTPA